MAGVLRRFAADGCASGGRMSETDHERDVLGLGLCPVGGEGSKQ